MQPIVSISCVTYNHAPFIKTCLDGFLMQQTSFAFEVVIHDDASTDGTREIIEEYTSKYPDVFFPMYQKENQYSQGIRGMMARFNFPRCRGKYIALCEGDDYWIDPLKLQKQVDFLEANSEYVVCYHDCNIVDENDRQVSLSILNQSYKKDYEKFEMAKGAWMPTLTRCFRNVVKIFPEEMFKITCGDLFITSLLSKYGKAKYIDICAASYRKHSNGVWNSKDYYSQEKIMINDYKYFCNYFLKTNNKELFYFYSDSLNNSFIKLLELGFKKERYVFLESIWINIKKNDRFFSRYFIKLTLKLLFIKIKVFMRRFRFFRSSNTWPKLSNNKKKFFIQKISIKTSVETLRDIQITIINKQKGAYMRFGDGDIFLMLGKDEMLQKANKKMAIEMKEAINFKAENIHKAFPINSRLFGYEDGMKEDMHLVSDSEALKYLSATYKFIDVKNIYTPVALHYLATFNQNICVDFLKFLRNTNPIFVGNQNIKPELLNKLFSDIHIKTPEANSYLEIDRIEGELRAVLDFTKEKFSVVVIAMGCPGRILQKRILKKGYNVYLFDFGSLLDAFNDDNTRLWIDLAGGTENLKSILNKLN